MFPVRAKAVAVPVTRLLLPASILLMMGALCATPAPAAQAFNSLKGSWSGGGSASFEGGSKEKLRCTGWYGGSGNVLTLSLKCASPSAQINLTGSLEANGSRVAGHWSENGFGMSGNAYGTTSEGSIRLRISGDASGTMTLKVSGARHAVAFATNTATLRGVNVSLSRR